MTPRLLVERTATASEETVLRDTGAFRVLAFGLLGAGLAAGAGIVAAGATRPAAVPALLLAVLLTLAVNRFALFPTELAVTAEGAVLVAAVVWYADGAAGAGAAGVLAVPCGLALLAGVVDLVHLRRGSVVRMAFNSGSRMLSVVAAGLVFLAVGGGSGAPGLRVLAAAAGAAAFLAVETGAGIALVRIRNTDRLAAAARIEMPLEAQGIPVLALGALAGFVGARLGWWAAVAVLVPTLFLPELAFGRWRRAWRRPRAARLDAIVLTVAPAAAAAALLGWFVGAPRACPFLLLVGTAIALGAESRLDTRRPDVPVLVAPIAVGAVVVGGDGAPLIAFAAAATVAATAVLLAGARSWWCPLLAGAGGVAAATVYELRPGPAAGVAALAACLLTCVLTVPFRRVVWGVPVGCVAVAAAPAWRDAGLGGAATFVAALALVVAAAVSAGAPPWPSRLAGTLVGRAARSAPRAILLAMAAAAAGAAVAAATVPGARELCVPAAGAIAGSVATLTAVAVRQWRFAPCRRARDAGLALAAALVAAVAYPEVGAGSGVGTGLVAVMLVGSSVVLATVVAWPLLRVAARTHASAPAR